LRRITARESRFPKPLTQSNNLSCCGTCSFMKEMREGDYLL
jgi:hypothetical protein